MVPPASRRIPRVLRYSGISSRPLVFAYVAFTPSGCAFQRSSANVPSLYADPQPRKACSPVWALSISLAATLEIDVSFFSSGYLDVSVPRVPACRAIHSPCGSRASLGWVSPFGYLRIDVCLRLPAAFRSWPRPSSAIGALASTLCSSSLDFFLRPTSSSVIFTHPFDWSFDSLFLPCAVVKMRLGALAPPSGSLAES